MSDILVYVNESSSCCVTVENSDVTLDTFRHEVEAQVGDVFCFPYKFTRLVNGKRFTVGAKQEVAVKLKQCIEESTDEPAIHLIREEIKTVESTLSPPVLKLQTERKMISSHRRLKKQRFRISPRCLICVLQADLELRNQNNLIQLQGQGRLRYTAKQKSRTVPV